MYREGETASELLAGVERMRKEMKYEYIESDKLTTYKYKLNSDSNRDAMKMGIENMKHNIFPTMLFCKELDKIHLNDHGKKYSFSRNESIPLSDTLFSTDIISEIDGEKDSKTIRRFISTSLIEKNEDLTKRFKKDRELRITITVEIDDLNNICPRNAHTPSLFCVFPLIGSEALKLPFIIDSPDFEPDSERESIFLDKTEEKKKGIITDVGINQLILKKSVILFDTLVEYLSKSGESLYNLLEGLKDVPKITKHFNPEWYELLMKDYQNILCKYTIVKTDVGNQKLFSPEIIFIKDDDDEGTLYDLCKDIFPSSRMPKKSIYKKWS
jgi:hypothetical protein